MENHALRDKVTVVEFTDDNFIYINGEKVYLSKVSKGTLWNEYLKLKKSYNALKSTHRALVDREKIIIADPLENDEFIEAVESIVAKYFNKTVKQITRPYNQTDGDKRDLLYYLIYTQHPLRITYKNISKRYGFKRSIAVSKAINKVLNYRTSSPEAQMLKDLEFLIHTQLKK